MAKQYNFQNIRALLIEGFSDEELRHLCFDVPTFKPVYDQLAKGTGKTEIVQRLLEYVEQKELVETLLDHAQKGNPAKYAEYQPYYDEISTNPTLSEEGYETEKAATPFPSPESAFTRPAINPGKVHLTAEVKAVLQAMFSGYDRLAIEAEFGRGLSGSRVFRVRPVMADGQAGLPEVVKVAPSALIRQERRAYECWVKGKLPFAARLEAAPPLSPGSWWDGLRYTLAGGGTFETQSLSDYYHQASPADLRWLLEQRLFQILGQHWWLSIRRTEADFQMQADYDPLLPVNLMIRPTASPPTGPVHRLGPDELPTLDLAAGDAVHLQGFIVTEVDRVGQQVTLNLPPAPEGRPFVSYRLRLKDPPNLDDYQEEQVIDSLYGQVVATRHELLVEQAKQALGGAVDLTAPTLPLPDYIAAPLRRFVATPPSSLPNPLLSYQDIPTFRTVKISIIHHDLNMENVLLDPATQAITLIDFASVREGHALHDLLHLETAIITKLVPPALAEAGLPAQAIWLLYAQLHRASLQPGSLTPSEPFHPALAKVWAMLVAIRSMAGHCLFNPKDWTEYYHGLILYLLGALKFKDLDAVPGAKEVAFWGAATTRALFRSTLYQEVKSEELQPQEQYTEERYLDAALPAHVEVGQDTELLILIRLPDSEGLKGLLEGEVEYQAQPEDVRSKRFEVEFPVDAKGNAISPELWIEVETSDFELHERRKKIKVEPRKDTEHCVFLLRPKKRGELRVVIQIYLAGKELLLGTGFIKVNGHTKLDKNGQHFKTLITLSLGAFGVNPRTKIVGAKVVFAEVNVSDTGGEKKMVNEDKRPTTIKASGGSIVVGDVSGSYNAIGPNAQVKVTHSNEDDPVAQVFTAIYQQIELRPDDPDIDKDELINITAQC
jgi:hypothetical protein